MTTLRVRAEKSRRFLQAVEIHPVTLAAKVLDETEVKSQEELDSQAKRFGDLYNAR